MRDEWVSPWWQALCLPDAWDVCGVRVAPLSVWHVFALTNLGNPFVVGGQIDMDAAESLLVIANRSMKEGRRLLVREFERGRATRKMFRRLSRMDEQDVFAACEEYVASCMRHGTRMSTPGVAGTPAGAPESWAIVVALMRSGMSWDAAWNMPYAAGRAFLDAADERGGRATMTPWDYGERMVDEWDKLKDDNTTREMRIA